MSVSVPVDSVDSVVPSSPLVSMVVKGLHGNRGLLPRARASDSCFIPALPGTGRLVGYEAIREVVVDVVHERCAALDISKRDAKVCVRVPGKRRGTFTSQVTTWGATSNQVLALREFLLAAGVTAVVIEATGDYWKPFYYLLEDGLNVLLVNARHV